MASPAPHPADAEGPSVLSENSFSPVDFTEISPSTFGISIQSFTTDRKVITATMVLSVDKTHLAKIKARRRATIGLRGSPDTNSLIRFMALQRAKTSQVLKTPEAVKSSPFRPRVSSALKEKMSSFQGLIDVEEGGSCDPVAWPQQDLSDGNLDSDKENCSGSVPRKRRRVGSPGGCETKISEASCGASSPILQHFSSRADPEFPSLASHTVKASESSFELQNSGAPLPVGLGDLPAPCALLFPASSSIPALLEMKPFGKHTELTWPFIWSLAPAFEARANSTGKKKRVRFGGPLSPELFDKSLPPSTPLQKGRTPGHPQTPSLGLGSGLRSLLKTPQRDFCSPLSTLSTQHWRSAQTPENNFGKIVFPSMEEADSPSVADTDTWITQPLDLNAAFHEQSLTESLPGGCAAAEPEAKPSEAPQAPPEELPRPQLVEEPAPAVDAQTHSSRPRRKPPQEGEPVKRSSRVAAKSATGKKKKARRWGSKEVDRSLYGSRAYASKNSDLSPITEGLGSQGPSLAPQSPRCGKHSKDIGENLARLFWPASEEEVSGHPAPDEVTLPVPLLQSEDTAPHTEPSEAPAPAPAAFPDQENSVSGRKKRASGPVRVLRRQGRNVSVCRELPEVQVEGTAPGQDLAAVKPGQSEDLTVADVVTCDVEGQSPQPLRGAEAHAGEGLEPQSHITLPSPVAPCPPPAVEAEVIVATPMVIEAQVALAPWQTDFTLEDVFKPTASRRQRSVRRSLRNRNNINININNNNNNEHCDSGLTWVAQTSPESIREVRRRTRGRRLSSIPGPQTQLEH
ncbi:hypothetical protein NHX12_029157 [Muraenolepis orangiensis]|uniref:PP1-binding domain-containing protein n=1 Tax=Muraenolepis orangiensis TaxID=630683 RepID=A0A9Q0ECS3_9TELE|nr:hypothetical protein NHX12_029157 [Muraenolepis orangiensis]